MGALVRFWRSTVGKKVVMAVTGVLLVAFIIGHAMGNLIVFRGPEAFNAYAAFLKSNMNVLWTIRAGLILAAVLHIVAAVQLTRHQQLARPVGYAQRDPQVSTYASRTIRWGGTILLVFVIYHLLHFTVGTAHPSFSHTDAYRNVIVGFGVWWVALLYVVAMVALGLHLYHGVWSSIRTLGLSRPTYQPLKRRAALVIAVAVTLGFIAIVVAVAAGFVR
ncbi:MAG TPA: succinate dehydrogenase cytochrome b subunit [Gemmatimonadaceae bacterium]|nr:succinate dehydrogenase cytochrome b subunit [Gemmatimonadaceae bacterium]